MDIPFFSIIIPTKNSAQTLPVCLESILNQSFQNFEIIIIDGLSFDETRSIIEEYQTTHSNIRWVSEKDEGIYDAMNKGIRMAKGEWLYFLGSDDSLYSLVVLEEIEKETEGFDVVYGNVTSPRFNGIYDGPFTKEKIYERNICHQAILFNKTVFQKIGGFNLRYTSLADWDHNFRWFLSGKIKKKYIDLIIANYADGGFSSVNAEPYFNQVKLWKYSVLTKSEINFINKLSIALSELFRAIRGKRKGDVFRIVSEIPNFLW